MSERWVASLLGGVAIAILGLPGHLAEAAGAARVPPECQQLKAADFEPTAITVAPLKLRTKYPEYSLLKGQWVFGDVVAILPTQTCLMILRKELIAGSQLWYLVRYRREVKQTAPASEGWVWGGSPGIDDTLYIRGDTTPKLKPGEGGASWRWSPVPAAYAQADTPTDATPSVALGMQGSIFGSGFPLWIITPPGSAILLFLIMVVGMVAKAVWDQTERGQVIPSSVQLIRPILISPIAFSTFSGALYVQQGGIGLSLAGLLFAFQIGFMWQHVLEKKLSQEESAARRGRAGN